MKLKPYPEYKDSGVEWIGEIPNNWSIRKVRYVLEDHKQGFYTNQDYVDNGTKLIRITDIDDYGNVSIVDSPSVDISKSEKSSFEVIPGDFLFARSGTIGRFGLVTENSEAIFASYLIRFRFTGIIKPKFVKYALLSKYFKEGLISSLHGGANQNIHAENIKEQNIIFPLDLRVQNRIVSFLDKKTSEIDLTMEKDTRLIELLKEKRTALINHVVTKGLDPTVKMKDSGVEWIGEIPEDWSVQKAKRICFFQEGPGLRHWQFQSSGIRVICVTNITENGIDFSNYEKFISNAEYKNSYKHFKVEKGDLLLSSSGNSWGKVAEFVSDETVILNTSTIRINENQNNKKVDRSFLKWILQADCVREQLGLMMTGSCQPNFGPSHLSKAMMCFPNSLEEQTQIGKILEDKTSKIDTVIHKIQKNIQLLEEYKKSLIHHVVTGKVDVREGAI